MEVKKIKKIVIYKNLEEKKQKQKPVNMIEWILFEKLEIKYLICFYYFRQEVVVQFMTLICHSSSKIIFRSK